MRYASSENTTLLGKFSPGKRVTITILDLQTDKQVNLSSDICFESNILPGLYLWNTSNINDLALMGYHDMYYRMMDQDGNTFDGKFVLGGYVDLDLHQELLNAGFDLTAIARILKIVNMRI